MSTFDCCLMLLRWLVWAQILWEINISASRSEHGYPCWIGTVAFCAPGSHWADGYIPDDQWVGRGWGILVKRLAWFKICFDDCWYLDSNVHGANMGPTWGRQDPGEPREPCYLGIYEIHLNTLGQFSFDEFYWCSSCYFEMEFSIFFIMS